MQSNVNSRTAALVFQDFFPILPLLLLPLVGSPDDDAGVITCTFNEVNLLVNIMKKKKNLKSCIGALFKWWDCLQLHWTHVCVFVCALHRTSHMYSVCVCVYSCVCPAFINTLAPSVFHQNVCFRPSRTRDTGRKHEGEKERDPAASQSAWLTEAELCLKYWDWGGLHFALPFPIRSHYSPMQFK